MSATSTKEDRAIYVYITDSSADIGEYIIVHVQANFYIKNFQYLVSDSVDWISAEGLYIIQRNGFVLMIFAYNLSYKVISKGIIVHSAKEEVEPLRNPIKTLSIPVSSSMAPSFEVLVYHITRDGFIFADSVSIPINKFDRQKVSL